MLGILLKPFRQFLVMGLVSAFFWLPGLEPSRANGIDVELELVLAIDVSASVNHAEYALQIKGLAEAFRHPDVITAIEAHGDRGIAVTVVQWSSGVQQSQDVPWMHLRDGPDADQMAQAIEKLERLVGVNTTAIGSAIRFSAELIDKNEFSGTRRSIDISGDGANNAGNPIWVEKNRALQKGLTINGLAILNGNPWLQNYYRDHVIGGPGSFMLTAVDFIDFTEAMRRKLIREINPAISNLPGETRFAENEKGD